MIRLVYLLAAFCFFGCDAGRMPFKKPSKILYVIYHNKNPICSGQFLSRRKLRGDEYWRGLESLDLEVKWKKEEEDMFEFEPDVEGGKLMTLRGDIEIGAGNMNVALKELRFIRQDGTNGKILDARSGWIIDPTQIDEIVKLARNQAVE